MIQAVVFDFDGLILDTETNEFKAWQDVFRQYGTELALDVWSGVIGTDMLSVFDPYNHLAELTGLKIDRDEVRRTVRENFAKRMESEQLRPGVVSVLEQARRLEIAIGLASSSSCDWVVGYLTKYGLRDYFDCIRTRDDVARVKPDPELYLLAVECLGVKPREALAFEDSANGAAAAHAAGLHCVVVPNAVTEGLAFGPHSKRLSTLEGLDLQRLIRELEG
jgi:HAD superfamily hydrolase (TIGR01509 family)